MHVALKVVQDSRFSLSAKFTAAHRLLRTTGFDQAVRAESIADKYFKVFFAGNGKENAKLGIIVGKKTLPCAADRNRIKRIIREAFRQHSIKLCKLDLVVMVRSAYSQENSMQIDNLKALFSRVENRCAKL